MHFIIGLIIGLFVMFAILFPILMVFRYRGKPIGDIRVDKSDPIDGPYLFLELDPQEGVGSIINKKQVSFRVKN